MEFDKKKLKEVLQHPGNAMFLTDKYLKVLDNLVDEYTALMKAMDKLEPEDVDNAIVNVSSLSSTSCFLCTCGIDHYFEKNYGKKEFLSKSMCNYCIHSAFEIAKDKNTIIQYSCVERAESIYYTMLSFSESFIKERNLFARYKHGGYSRASKAKQAEIRDAVKVICKSRLEVWHAVIEIIEEIINEKE